MTNGEKFKTAHQRRAAYYDYCSECLRKDKIVEDKFEWLELEAEEELLPCPFCGGEAKVKEARSAGVKYYFVECTKCFGKTVSHLKQEDAIAAWNRRAK